MNSSARPNADGRRTRTAGGANLCSCFPAVEKVLASDCLTVLPVLDLHPGCRFGRVPGVRLLGDDSLHVPVANHAEQVCASRNVFHIQNGLRVPREQFPQEFLPLKERQVPQVAVIQPEQIEGIKAEAGRLRCEFRAGL
jgi:hypothetical protein